MDKSLSKRLETGSATVEFILCVPILLILIFGGFHLGRLLWERHRLVDAVNYATRTAAVTKTTDTVTVQGLVSGRFGNTGPCDTLTVTVEQTSVVSGVDKLLVIATCLYPLFSWGSTTVFNETTLRATAAMPVVL